MLGLEENCRGGFSGLGKVSCRNNQVTLEVTTCVRVLD